MTRRCATAGCFRDALPRRDGWTFAVCETCLRALLRGAFGVAP